MWGNDPELTPQAHQQGARIKESWINPDLRTPNHLGWLGRLNGPVDNPASACTSCHGTAQVPVRSPMIPRQTDPDIMRWFRNIRAGDSFDQRAISTDYSLQISMGIQNFMLWKQSQGGFVAPPPAAGASPPAPSPSAAFSPAATAQDTIIVNNEVVYRVSRD
jgi:hypothetical protein